MSVAERSGRYRTITTVYPVRDASGRLFAEHVRQDRPDGSKELKWRRPGGGWGLHGMRLERLPLYGSERLAYMPKDRPIVLTEGEKACDALEAVGIPAVGTVTGAACTPGPAALEALRGLEVVLWPDADDSGREHMDRIAEGLEGVAERVRLFVPHEPAEKGADAADHPAILSGGEKALGILLNDLMGAPEWEPTRPVSVLPAPSVPEPPPWPVLADEALHGLAGEIVGAIDPHTEADRVAVLGNLLAAFGNAMGRGAFFRVGADRHYLKLYFGLVGETSKGRKGTSWGYVRELMHAVDGAWSEERVQNGLSSGEGLIYAVRNRVEGENKKGETVTLDSGVEDKRLLVLEPELAGVLKVMSREGNTLSPLIRQAWDDGTLQTLTKNNPMKSTDAHVSIIGHITSTELRRHLTETEAANGFANRFGLLLVRRSKELPFGGEWAKVDTAPLVRRLESALDFGRAPVEVVWAEDAREPWREVYGPLSEGKPGLFGAVVGRAEAQVMRLAAIYAVMDESHEIGHAHLLAALALWKYAEASARYIFGDATGDPAADQIAEALKSAGGDGMTRTDISGLFGRNKSANQIGRALGMLLSIGRARRETEETKGRPSERWFAR